MSLQPLLVWRRMRDGLWFVPGIMTFAAMVLAGVLVRLDTTYLGAELARDAWWLFGGNPQGARGMLSTIAGSVITVAGVVFSITIVALQLASTQFTPRVLQNFMSDRGNQIVLGVFIGTFAYTLLVLRTVRSADDTGAGAFVPYAAITVAILLALLSMAVLIYYLSHVTGWIEASGIIRRVTEDTMQEIRAHFPLVERAREGVAPQDGRSDPDLPARADAAVVMARGSGYVQAVDEDRMLALAETHDAVVELTRAIGDFVLDATPLFFLWPRERYDYRLGDQLREAVALGQRRTIRRDPTLGILQLSDIAVKALSPSVNDPTTAVLAIDRLGEVVAELAGRFPPQHVRRDAQGNVRTAHPAFSFADALDAAFAQIRHYAGTDAVVLAHLVRTIGSLGPRVGSTERDSLLRVLDDIREASSLHVRHSADRARVEEALARASAALSR